MDGHVTGRRWPWFVAWAAVGACLGLSLSALALVTFPLAVVLAAVLHRQSRGRVLLGVVAGLGVAIAFFGGLHPNYQACSSARFVGHGGVVYSCGGVDGSLWLLFGVVAAIAAVAGYWYAAHSSEATHTRTSRDRPHPGSPLALVLAAIVLGAAALLAYGAPARATSGTSGSSGATGTTAVPPLLGPPRIVKDFIPFGPARKAQMRAYAELHYGIDSFHIVGPHLVIWHFTATTTFSSVWNTFADDVPDVQFHALPQVCAHFVINTDGTIYQLVPLNIMCRQVVGLDYTAIGIENVGMADQQVIGDAAQYRAGLELTRWLRCRCGLPVRNVIGHNESLSSPYYRERVPSWRGQTHEDFNRHDMNVVRTAVAKLPCRA